MMDVPAAIRFLAWALAITAGVSGVNLILMWRYIKEKEAER